MQYILDPSYPKSNQKITACQNKLALTANGWVRNNQLSMVRFTDGTSGSFRYRLNLRKACKVTPSRLLQKEVPKQAAPVIPVNMDKACKTTCNTSLSYDGCRWGLAAFIVESNGAHKQFQFIEYTLHPTIPEPIVQRVAMVGMHSSICYIRKATSLSSFDIAGNLCPRRHCRACWWLM
jgi:hypothetical protein